MILANFGKVILSQGDGMADWKFYGRKEQLADLERMLDRKRWFFAIVTGRRRIGKTTLIQRAMQEIKSKQPVFYVQIPDSEPTGVLSALNDALETFHIQEFQYFNRKGYEQFCSYLQASVDRLAAKADQVQGGLIVLGAHAQRTCTSHSGSQRKS